MVSLKNRLADIKNTSTAGTMDPHPLLLLISSLQTVKTLAGNHIVTQETSWDNKLEKAHTAQCEDMAGCLVPLCDERNLMGSADGNNGNNHPDVRGRSGEKMKLSHTPHPGFDPSSLSVGKRTKNNNNNKISVKKTTSMRCFLKTTKSIFHFDVNMKKTKLSIKGWRKADRFARFCYDGGHFYFINRKGVLKVGKYTRFKVKFRAYRHNSHLANRNVRNLAVDTKKNLLVVENPPIIMVIDMKSRTLKIKRKMRGAELHVDKCNRIIFYKEDRSWLVTTDYRGARMKLFKKTGLLTDMLLMNSRVDSVMFYACSKTFLKYEINLDTKEIKISKMRIDSECMDVKAIINLGDRLLVVKEDGRGILSARGKKLSSFRFFKQTRTFNIIRIDDF